MNRAGEKKNEKSKGNDCDGAQGARRNCGGGFPRGGKEERKVL